MTARFNPAPGWPTPPPGWVPPAGWTRPPDWPRTPAGWPFWVDDVTGVPVADPAARTGTGRNLLVVLAGAVTVVVLGTVAAASAGGGTGAPVAAPTPVATRATAGSGADEVADRAAASEAAAEAAEAAAAEAARGRGLGAGRAGRGRGRARGGAGGGWSRPSRPRSASRPPRQQAAAAQAAAERAAATWTVTAVVDGDTVDVRQGELTDRVRVIGIDTPERGECGYEQATDVLAGHVLRQDVVLVPGARDDRDSYDRVLRSSTGPPTASTAAGRCWTPGWRWPGTTPATATAPTRARPDYVAADAATADTAVCAPAPPPGPPRPRPRPRWRLCPLVDTRAGCDPAYPTVCLPSSPDVDCGEIRLPVLRGAGAGPAPPRRERRRRGRLRVRLSGLRPGHSAGQGGRVPGQDARRPRGRSALSG